MSSSLVVIYMTNSGIMILLSQRDLSSPCAPQDYIKIKNGLTVLVVHMSQIGLSVKKERKGEE